MLLILIITSTIYYTRSIVLLIFYACVRVRTSMIARVSWESVHWDMKNGRINQLLFPLKSSENVWKFGDDPLELFIIFLLEF